MGAELKAIAVYTTLGSETEAQALAKKVIEQRLAACAQINRIESYYHWQGAVEHEPEWRILFKTTKEAYSALETFLAENHPYEEPAIYAVDVVAGAEGYLGWISDNVKLE